MSSKSSKKNASYSSVKEKTVEHYQKEFRKYVTAQTKIIFDRPVDKTSARYNELHPSSYPWCGLEQAYCEAKDIKPRAFDMYGDLYTGVGTVVHEVVQDYLGHRGSMYGEWACKGCGVMQRTIKKKGKLSTPIKCPTKCPECGHTQFKYEELGIKFGKWTYGHLDGLIELDGKLFVVDYKTTSPEKNKQHRQHGNVYPYLKNRAQIESYCVYLEQEYNVKIHGWILVYVSRDNFLKDYVTVMGIVDEEEKERLLKKYKIYDKAYGRVHKLREGYDSKLWAKLIKHKPCSSMADYKLNMFDGFDMCPLAKDGTCFNKARLKNEIKNLNRKIKVINEI